MDYNISVEIPILWEKKLGGNTMKKAFALLLTLAMALGCLAGCGNSSTSSAPA